jgi:predicted ATPase/DNA-binding winged helix-turn-helix (wHTH) protein
MTIDDGGRPHGWRIANGERSFRLFLERRQLLSGDVELKMKPRPFDLLVYFTENAGRVISKTELLSTVWKDCGATEAAISTQVSVLRGIFGGAAIKSVNSKGYQFTLEVGPVDVPLGAPPLRQASVSLPHLPDTGIGRTAELARLADLSAEHRLTTLVGPGGVGKTWLAIRHGWQSIERFPDGIHLVDLGPVTETLAVAGTVAKALGVALRRGDAPDALLAAAVGRRRMLLIFDSCEYVLEAVRDLVKVMLALAPNLTVLATSQEPLGLSKEALLPLSPLPQEDAEALFVQCCQAAGRPPLRSDPDTAAIVSEICRRLDGIPLALELAAGRVPTIGIEGVRDGLDHRRFRVLDAKKRNGEARQSSLSAIVDWSYGLLDDADRLMFRRLGRFRGSFSHEAVKAVAGIDEWDAEASLGRLVEKSLLVAEISNRPRYYMLETLRFHAEARLRESGEEDETAERHARFYTGLFERADLAWEMMPDADWAALYGPDIDNLRMALDWAMAEPARLSVAIALGGAGAHLWERLDLSAEGRGYLDRLVERLDDETPTADAARVLQRASTLWRRIDRARASAYIERSVAQYRRLGDHARLGVALALAGGDDIFLGRYEGAKAALIEAQTLLNGSNRVKSSLRVMLNLGTLAQRENRVDDAKSAFQMARDLTQTLKDPLREYITVNNLAVLEFRIDNVSQATEHFRDAASGFRVIGQAAYLGMALVNLAACLALKGADAEARKHAAEALLLTRVDGGSWLRLCLECWAFLAARADQHAEAARLLGFIEAGIIRSGEVRAALSQRVYNEAMRLLAAHCGADDIRAWAEDGARWSETQAADFASRRLATPES